MKFDYPELYHPKTNWMALCGTGKIQPQLRLKKYHKQGQPFELIVDTDKYGDVQIWKSHVPYGYHPDIKIARSSDGQKYSLCNIRTSKDGTPYITWAHMNIPISYIVERNASAVPDYNAW